MAADAELDALLVAPPVACKGRVRKLVDKPKWILSLIGGFNRRWEAISFAKGEMNARVIVEVDYISRQLRLGGAAAAFVEVAGADNVADAREMVAEQARAKGEFSGPLAVLYAGKVETPYHVGANGLVPLRRGGTARVYNRQPRVFMAAIDGTHRSNAARVKRNACHSPRARALPQVRVLTTSWGPWCPRCLRKAVATPCSPRC